MENQNDFYKDKTEEIKNDDFFSDEKEGNESDGFFDNGDPTFEDIPPYAAGKPAQQKTVTYAVISLLSGIISLLCCCTGFGGLFFGAVAIVFFFISKKHLGTYDFRSILGLIFGICGILFALYLVISLLTVDPDELLAEMEKALEASAAGGTEV